MLPTIFASFGLLAVALAAPFQHENRDVLIVYSPKITSPTASTTWIVGNTYDVTWYVSFVASVIARTIEPHRDTSGLPPVNNLTNILGEVVLGQFNGDTEHLFPGEH